MQNKPSILINKIKGQNKSTNLFKHAFREVKTLPKNIFKSFFCIGCCWSLQAARLIAVGVVIIKDEINFRSFRIILDHLIFYQ